MSDNLVLEHLRHIRATVDGLRDDMHGVKERLGLLVQTCASISRRVDRLEDRVERIGRRLDIIPA